MGRRTRAAWRVMKDAHESSFSGYLRDLPELSRGNAIHWCRELPAVDASIAALRPSSRPVRILANSNLAEQVVRQSYVSAQAFVQREFGIVLAGDIGIAAGDEPEVLKDHASRIKAETSAIASDSDKAILNKCGGKTRIVGGAYLNWMYFCWPRLKKVSKEQLRYNLRFWAGEVVIHEYVHLVQAELSGARTNVRSLEDQSRLMGPAWMFEGVAQVIGAMYEEAVLGREQPSIEQLWRKAKAAEVFLYELHGLATVRSDETYDLSRYAVEVLAQAHGIGALFEFWRRLGAGETWREAFRACFGVEMDEFEGKVIKIRMDPKTERQFSSGNALQRQLNAIPDPIKIIPLRPVTSFDGLEPKDLLRPGFP